MGGSTDPHTSISNAEQENFFGKTAAAEPRAERWEHVFIKNTKMGLVYYNWETNASGYAAVWAMENTRESLWDAMQRRETYATTGSRMVVRFFGGFDFDAK